ncbi:COG0451: Nucleoside-diphosphate-sugar epimerases [hydrothermal vent metagenome]|uniref:COG0451: Nucleoside-diphosphate-sugar epimerases n=1 Tax=hydrothermal vent metagenome TaxID=652676 RepID=A0A3B0UIS5_9ZZZZ
MQTILGAGGVIATELAKSLVAHTKDIRLVSRNPKKVNSSDLLLPLDLTSTNNIDKAIEGSEIVYVTIGFAYSYKEWQAKWPPFIENVVLACKKYNSKLVFFDNIYMYDQNQLDGMTEGTAINPPSKKGQVRAKVAKIIMDEVEAGTLTALIARCADYYGPEIERNGIIQEMIFKNFATGKKANWLGSDKFKHSVTYTPDAGKATAILGNTEDAYNQVWHLPTASNPLTGKEWIEIIAKEMGAKPSYQVANKFIVSIMGIFMPIMREMKEMLYQYDRNYVFNSSKFEKRFNFTPTPYLTGIKEIIKADYQ